MRKRTSFIPVQVFQVRNPAPRQVFPGGQVNSSEEKMKADQASDHHSEQSDKQCK
jgi:hypothetical protein